MATTIGSRPLSSARRARRSTLPSLCQTGYLNAARGRRAQFLEREHRKGGSQRRVRESLARLSAQCGPSALPAWPSQTPPRRPNCFNRHHPQIPTVAQAKPGDLIVFHTRRAPLCDLPLDANADDLAAADLIVVHLTTDPVRSRAPSEGMSSRRRWSRSSPIGSAIPSSSWASASSGMSTEPYLVNWKLYAH